MANTKSAKKQARKNETRRLQNLSRRTKIKTTVKKVLAAIEEGDAAKTQELLADVAAKLARAKNKNVMHPKTASRKLSRLAKRAHAAQKTAAK